jgi:hypothetical protein
MLPLPARLPSPHLTSHLAYLPLSSTDQDEFAHDPNFLRAAALDATSSAPTKQKHQTVRLSSFDITSPTSPVSDAAPPLDSTTTMPPRPARPRD